MVLVVEGPGLTWRFEGLGPGSSRALSCMGQLHLRVANH